MLILTRITLTCTLTRRKPKSSTSPPNSSISIQLFSPIPPLRVGRPRGRLMQPMLLPQPLHQPTPPLPALIFPIAPVERPRARLAAITPSIRHPGVATANDSSQSSPSW
ncbi:hypothetical protein [Bifidobacterium vansinderenii]|uniref:hypothetical protein n=1 Tax=Bifidobacterium vansinderenii TaxID=1984871 RepID=UPI0013032E39|nr:hypothetical protein [Bifidobacterium vansinderenii]